MPCSFPSFLKFLKLYVLLLSLLSSLLLYVGAGAHANLREGNNLRELVLFFYHVSSEDLNFGHRAWQQALFHIEASPGLTLSF